jgi:ribosomal protein L10
MASKDSTTENKKKGRTTVSPIKQKSVQEIKELIDKYPVVAIKKEFGD